MGDYPPLSALGDRICICGPSNAGKSTLAVALGTKLGVAATHLDLLYHQPNTNWVPRSKEEFSALHAETMAGERWVVEGNYFGWIEPRLARATGIILLGSEPWLGLFRYVRRTLFQRQRAGMLAGGIDRLNLEMPRFILFEQPKKRARDQGILRASGLPMVELGSMRELDSLYEAWDLRR
jgi:adenylate kinase family enzyme